MLSASLNTISSFPSFTQTTYYVQWVHCITYILVTSYWQVIEIFPINIIIIIIIIIIINA